MKANEFINEDGTAMAASTVSGNVATIAMPIGTIMRRQPVSVKPKKKRTAKKSS